MHAKKSFNFRVWALLLSDVTRKAGCVMKQWVSRPNRCNLTPASVLAHSFLTATVLYFLLLPYFIFCYYTTQWFWWKQHIAELSSSHAKPLNKSLKKLEKSLNYFQVCINPAHNRKARADFKGCVFHLLMGWRSVDCSEVTDIFIKNGSNILQKKKKQHSFEYKEIHDL